MCSEANEARFDPGWVLLAMNQELAAVISKGPTRPGRVRLACFAPCTLIELWHLLNASKQSTITSSERVVEQLSLRRHFHA